MSHMTTDDKLKQHSWDKLFHATVNTLSLCNSLPVLQKPHHQMLSLSEEMASPAWASPLRPARRTVTAAWEQGSLPEVLNLQIWLTSPHSHPWPALMIQVWQNMSQLHLTCQYLLHRSFSTVYKKRHTDYYTNYLCKHSQGGISFNDLCTPYVQIVFITVSDLVSSSVFDWTRRWVSRG